jgi:hypothetical protein
MNDSLIQRLRNPECVNYDVGSSGVAIVGAISIRR